MPRRLLNPNTLNASPTAQDIRRALVDLWSLVGEFPPVVTADYTTTGNVALERLICTNSSAITVTLHYPAKDGDEVIIKRQNAGVTVAGNGNTIDGASSLIIVSQYDSPHLVYTDEGAEWSII